MIRFLFFAALAACTATMVSGQEPPTAPPPAVPSPAQLPVDIQADRLEYRDNNRTMVATGNVVITQGDSVLRSDYMSVDTETYDVHGRGNVDIVHNGRTYQGDEFHYNMRTRTGDFEEFLMIDPPFSVVAEDSQRLDENRFLLQEATITTCDVDAPEFYVRARESVVTRDQDIRSKHVFFYLGGVPFFYLPFLNHDLSGEKTNFDVTPGYSDEFGGFLLTAYNYRVSDIFSAATHLDYRDKRGLGFGQDVFWKDPVANAYEGEFSAYYTDDDMPFDDELDEAANGDLIDSDRYRFKLRHRQQLSDDNTLRVRGDYLSDPDVIEDFFNREFRYNTQPENFVTLTHRDDKYIAGLTVNRKVNDFYSNINRIPEFTFDVPRMQLGDSAFYYTSANRASYLEASFADQLNREDYDSGRIDSDHTVYYFTRQFGFLNLIPRAGFAATYYSKSLDRSTVTESTVVTNELGEVSTEESTRTVLDLDGGSEVRGVFQIGMEGSYKAFRVLDSRTRGNDVGRRHVFEPFFNYTYIPEPNVEPEELLQFDTIDRRDENHDFLFGVRNKLQTKRRGYIHDLIDLNLFTVYNVEKVNNEQDSLPSIFYDGEFRFFDGVWLDIDGFYDVPEGEINTFNAQVAVRGNEFTTGSLEYRYTKDARDLIAGEFNLFPNRRWSYLGYARYDFEGSDLQEHSHLVTRKSDCLGVGVGIREVDDSLTVYGQVWLTAFPRGIAQLGR